MKLLLKIRDQDIDPDLPLVDESKFDARQTIRAVLIGTNNEILLIKVNAYDYYKLPGGGIEKNEKALDALQRELLEEVGFRAEVINELGRVIEYRGWEKLEQVSDCYLARRIGELKPLSLDDYEKEEGFESYSARGIDEAIKLFENEVPTNLEGKFIKLRDITFLKEARQYLKKL